MQPDNFSPFPKNPVIARVFKEIGRADELGSGVRNIFEYFNYYSLQKPILEEKDIFKCTVFTDKIEQETKGIKYVGDKVGDVGGNVGGNVGDKVGDVGDLSEEKRLEFILKLMAKNNVITIRQLSKLLGVTPKTIERDISKLKNANKLLRIGNPKSGSWQIIE